MASPAVKLRTRQSGDSSTKGGLSAVLRNPTRYSLKSRARRTPIAAPQMVSAKLSTSN